MVLVILEFGICALMSLSLSLLVCFLAYRSRFKYMSSLHHIKRNVRIFFSLQLRSRFKVIDAHKIIQSKLIVFKTVLESFF